MNFTGSHTENESNFPWQNNLILQKMVSSLDKVANFKDFSRPNKEMKYFSSSRRLLKLKTLSTLYEPCETSNYFLFIFFFATTVFMESQENILTPFLLPKNTKGDNKT